MGAVLGGAVGAAVIVQHPRLAGKLRTKIASLQASLLPKPAPIAEKADVVIVIDDRGLGTDISPLIYGVSFAGTSQLQVLKPTSNRWGGNSASTFNWVNGHAWNAGRDWEFRNNDGGRSGNAVDTFIAQSLAAGAQPLITVPTLGWVASDADNGHRSTNVPGSGGDPVTTGSDAISGYDPAANRARTSLQSLPSKTALSSGQPIPSGTVVYQDDWIRHLVSQFGSVAAWQRCFAMDNEPDLWSVTHTDVHPVRMGYQAMVDNFLAYAGAVKAADPSTKVLGPDVSGWTGYWYSDLDRGSDNFATHADRAAHGNMAFLPWWLSQIAAHDAATGHRTLDFLDVHYYPQASGIDSNANDPATQALRMRSVRSLYDPNYKDESWIGEPVVLIPRLKDWLRKEYPGTKLAITEYNWGGEKDASGAVALAEVLGVFGREGVDMANYWPYPPHDSPASAAFRLYRNYDGAGATFGDRSLPVTSDRPSVVAFASRHSDSGALNLMVANESLDQPGRVSVKLKSGSGRQGQVDVYLLRPGSSAIEHVQPSASGVIEIPPLGVALVTLAS